MNKEDFDKLIDKDKYQVFVFCSPASFPINFAKHPWFVLNKKGIISRWEIMHFKNKSNKDFGYLHLNNKAPFLGIGLVWLVSKFYWKAKLLSSIEGSENSIAQKAIEFIENSKETYPYIYKYSFLGPNSNTFLFWVLNKFPELDIKLSWHFIGKNFSMSKTVFDTITSNLT